MSPSGPGEGQEKNEDQDSSLTPEEIEQKAKMEKDLEKVRRAYE